MELIKEIFVKALSAECVSMALEDIDMESVINRIRDNNCKALEGMRKVIMDDELSDFDCIESIVCIFEALGSSGGERHDF